MSNNSQNNSGVIIAGAIILGSIIVGLFLYLGLQKSSSVNSSQMPNKSLTSDSQNSSSAVAQNSSKNLSQDKAQKNTNKNTSSKLENTQSSLKEETSDKTSKKKIAFSDEFLIKQALLEVTEIPEDKLEFSIAYNNGQIARGTVKNKDDQGGAGWFAAKNQSTQNKWVVTYNGQGVPYCSEVNPYNYPISWADYCIDTQGNTVKR